MKTTMYDSNERLTCAVRVINLLIALVFTLTSTVYGVPNNMVQTRSGQEEKVQPVEPLAAYLDPAKLVVPENYGTVTERFKSSGTENSRKVIIQVQDSHCNYEAQTNIMKIMEGMSADKETAQAFKLIATEGATGALDASFPRSFPNDEVKKQASDYFLRIGWLTGPEMYEINFKEEPVPLWGVEDKGLYDENLSCFRKAKGGLEKERAFLDKMTALIEILKMKVLSKGVNEMVRMREGWDKNTVQFTEYCTYIEKLALENGMGGKGAQTFKDAIEYPNFSLVVESMEIEKKIDAKKIDSERQMMIAQLQARMVKEELAELVKQSLYLRTGKITSDMFYSYLKDAAAAKKIDTSKYPNLGGYMEIVFRNSTVNAGALFEEVDRIEKAIKNRIYASDAERKLDEMIDQVKLLRNLLDLRMTRRDLTYYKERRRFLTPTELIRRVAMISEESGMKDALAGSIGWLETNKEIDMAACEGFYDAAIKRDKVLAENTIDEMEKRKATAVALVTGGFHTQGTKELFKAKGYSYVVVTPRMTQTYDDKYYLARMMNEQSEFDKMFSNAGTRLAAPDMLSEERMAEFCRAFYVEVATILSETKKASEINAALNAWLQEPVNAEIAKLIGSEVQFINAVPKGKTWDLTFQFTSNDGSVVERTFAYDSGKKIEKQLALVSEKPLAREKRVAAAEKAIAPEARPEAPAAEEPAGPTDAEIRASLDELIAQHPDLIRSEEKEGEARYQVRRAFVQNKSIVFDKSENAWIDCKDPRDALKKINALLATLQKPATLDDLMANLRVPSTRKNAEKELAAYGNKAVSKLSTRLSSRTVSADERAAIARILGAIGTPLSIAALKKMLDGEKESTVMSEVIRGLAVSADPTVIPVIAKYIGNQDKDVAFEAQEGLIKIGEPAVGALTTMLKGRLNMSVDTITRAVDTLAVIAGKTSDAKKRDEARNAIVTVVKDGNLNEKKLLARFAAVRALTEMRDADGATAAFFKRMLGREDLPAGYSAEDLLEPVCVRMALDLNDNQKNYYKNAADKTVAVLLEREVDLPPVGQMAGRGMTAHVMDVDETHHMDAYAVQQYLEKGIPSSKPPVTVTVDKLAEEYGVVLSDDLLASLKDVEVVIDEVDDVGYVEARPSKMDMEPVKALSGEVNGKKRIRMTRGYLDRMRAYGLRTALADVFIHEDAELMKLKFHNEANDIELGGRLMSDRILLDILIAKERGNTEFLQNLKVFTGAANVRIAVNPYISDETRQQRYVLTRNIELVADALLAIEGKVDEKTIARELKDQITLLAQLNEFIDMGLLYRDLNDKTKYQLNDRWARPGNPSLMTVRLLPGVDAKQAVNAAWEKYSRVTNPDYPKDEFGTIMEGRIKIEEPPAAVPAEEALKGLASKLQANGITAEDIDTITASFTWIAGSSTYPQVYDAGRKISRISNGRVLNEWSINEWLDAELQRLNIAPEAKGLLLDAIRIIYYDDNNKAREFDAAMGFGNDFKGMFPQKPAAPAAGGFYKIVSVDNDDLALTNEENELLFDLLLNIKKRARRLMTVPGGSGDLVQTINGVKEKVAFSWYGLGKALQNKQSLNVLLLRLYPEPADAGKRDALAALLLRLNGVAEAMHVSKDGENGIFLFKDISGVSGDTLIGAAKEIIDHEAYEIFWFNFIIRELKGRGIAIDAGAIKDALRKAHIIAQKQKQIDGEKANTPQTVLFSQLKDPKKFSEKNLLEVASTTYAERAEQREIANSYLKALYPPEDLQQADKFEERFQARAAIELADRLQRFDGAVDASNLRKREEILIQLQGLPGLKVSNKGREQIAGALDKIRAMVAAQDRANTVARMEGNREQLIRDLDTLNDLKAKLGGEAAPALALTVKKDSLTANELAEAREILIRLHLNGSLGFQMGDYDFDKQVEYLTRRAREIKNESDPTLNDMTRNVLRNMRLDTKRIMGVMSAMYAVEVEWDLQTLNYYKDNKTAPEVLAIIRRLYAKGVFERFYSPMFNSAVMTLLQLDKNQPYEKVIETQKEFIASLYDNLVRDAWQLAREAKPQYAMAGYGSRGDEGLPNEEYTADIRDNLESGNYVALSYNDTKKSLETAAVVADSGVKKLLPPAETIGEKAMAEFNRLLDMLKKEDRAMAAKIKGITFILMRNQRPHYGLGRPQIYLDLNKLESDPAAFMESLKHEINERSAIVAGLGAENMKVVEKTKNDLQSRRNELIYKDKPNQNNLAAEIDRLAAISHNEQVNKELNGIVALKDEAQLNKLLTETRKAIGDIEANTAYTDRVKELMKTRYEEKVTAVRMALLKIRLEKEIKTMPEKSVVRGAVEEILAALATDNYRNIKACLMDARSVMPFDGGKKIDEIVKSLLDADKDALGKFIGYVLNRAGYIGHKPKMNSDFDNLCLALAAAWEARETPRGLVLIDSMFKGMSVEEINLYLEKVVLRAADMGLDMVLGLSNEFYAEHKTQVDAIVKAVMQKHPGRQKDQILIRESDRVKLAQMVDAAVDTTTWKGSVTLAVGMDELHLYAMMAQRVVNLLLSDGNSLSMADEAFLKSHGLAAVANFEKLLPIVQHGKDLLDAKQEAFNTFGFAA